MSKESDDLFGRWKSALSQRIGRSAGSILEDGLLPADFPETDVRIVFGDGSNLLFRRAFFLGDIERRAVDMTICRLAVFAANIGHHEFWIDSQDSIQVTTGRPSFTELPEKCDSDTPKAYEEQAWYIVAPVEREFRNPDYERLFKRDLTEFHSGLADIIKVCNVWPEFKEFSLSSEEVSDTANVQAALQEVGHDVSFRMAACVWKHYSEMYTASWMAGAETVHSAKQQLYFYCVRKVTKTPKRGSV